MSAEFKNEVFAPVNIAWIKYMGKSDVGPSNDSLSMTLSRFGTTTELQFFPENSGNVSIQFAKTSPYIPPETGRKKAQNFLSQTPLFWEVLGSLGFASKSFNGRVELSTQNNVPAGTGVATSASGFAALTLCYIDFLAWISEGSPGQKRFREAFLNSAEFRSRVAKVASFGSGSACRSFDGPFVKWSTDHQVQALKTTHRYTDFLILCEDRPKEVSSSDAHVRVKTSPRFTARLSSVNTRLEFVMECLKAPPTPEVWLKLANAVREEALEMHELFHTSVPSFSYLNRSSLEILSCIRNEKTPTPHGILTFDAGANAHLFVPEGEASVWREFLSQQFSSLRILEDECGRGAYLK
jgi:diphosphomevalonate decarboxylase